MSIKQTILSYSPYAIVGSAASVANQDTPEKIKAMTEKIIYDTKLEAPWMYELFPTLVDQGSLVLKDGHIYLYAISLTDLLTFFIALFTFSFLLIKSLADLNLIGLNRKVAIMQKEDIERARSIAPPIKRPRSRKRPKSTQEK